MTKISRSTLFSKLNKPLYNSLESAFTLCRFRENNYVELVHWLNVLVQSEENDFYHVFTNYSVNIEQLKTDTLTALENLPKGATNVADISQHIEQTVEESWTYTSLLFNSSTIRGAHILYALLKSANLKSILLDISSEFNKLKSEDLAENILNIIKDSNESETSPNTGNNENINRQHPESALQNYGTDLTELAKNGKIDPVIGRDDEIRQLIDILMRRRQNNPILTGEAGVGKTAVVEGLALKLAQGEVPPSLKDVSLVLLDIGSLKAGASVSGEFESRLKKVMEEVESSPAPIILFIDEIHTLIGAGGAAGTADAANLLKPALARGKLRTIGATTWSEYKKYFEKDPALTRRFQVIQVNEPEENKAVEMLRGLANSLEKHHGVMILNEALVASVHLSHRYIPERKLPDKAIGLLDTACARVALSQYATPSKVEFLNRKKQALETEQKNLKREEKLDYEQTERLDEIIESLDSISKTLIETEARWQSELALVTKLKEVREKILNHDGNNSESQMENSELPTEQLDTISTESECSSIETLREEQKSLINELRAVQSDEPMIMPLVDKSSIAKVVSDWTGIPVGKMVKDELKSILELSDSLNARVINQKHGIDAISKRIQTSSANLDDPNKPVGVFMLAGPSGVGKTETALALADTLYGGEHNLITINMSEYQESHSISTLKGAPPGYVGFGEGGVLTEAVRRKPYSVILLDEIEKAHPDVHEIFFQVFDKGWMEDGEGRYIDFKNTVIILTTNAGSDLIMNSCYQQDNIDLEEIQKQLRKPLLEVFPPALLGRINVIPYYPLSDESLGKIVKLQLNKIVKRIKENHKITLDYNDEVIKLIVSRCLEVESGGRMIDSILTNTILPEISKQLLQNIIDGSEIQNILISVSDSQFVYSFD